MRDSTLSAANPAVLVTPALCPRSCFRLTSPPYHAEGLEELTAVTPAEGRSMKKMLAAAIIALTTAPAIATGVTVFLQRQEVRGQYRYCYYTGGYILTVQAYELCPLSVTPR